MGISSALKTSNKYECSCSVYNGIDFPFPTKALVESPTLKACNASNAEHMSFPRDADTCCTSIRRLFVP